MHCLVQWVRKILDFCEIPIGQNVSNFFPRVLITFIWICVFVFLVPTLFFVDICQRPTTSSSPITRFPSSTEIKIRIFSFNHCKEEIGNTEIRGLSNTVNYSYFE